MSRYDIFFAFDFTENWKSDFTDNIYHFYAESEESILHNNKKLLNDFSDIFHEVQGHDEFYNLMFDGYTKQLIVNTYRYFKAANQPVFRITYNENHLGSAVYTVIRYIDQNYRDITDIRTIANQLGYSYTYLAHIFKEKMDMTIGDYVIKNKMEEAKELLNSGRMNVTQVSERLQYMSIQSFSNSFKKIYGISPSEYQRKVKESENAMVQEKKRM